MQEIERILAHADSTNPQAALSWIASEYPGQCAFSSSLGAEDQVITHMIAAQNLPVRVFTLDTGRLFPETYDLLEVTGKKYHLSIEVFYPKTASVQAMVNAKGINLFYDSKENRIECCHIRKVEPLHRSLRNTKIWITGLRKDQSDTRKQIDFVEYDKQFSIIKVNPIFEWNDQQVFSYLKTHQVPYNPLHDKGYPSIGCQPCTRAVFPGEDSRSGRWWWEQDAHRECGLHQH
ncbi:MAG: phosphoadenylyl-sulfate reductase [Bacteroidetes bacterium]|nr:phosphoadenylyl-sulfate reductase [Bacteroidota bacterium]